MQDSGTTKAVKESEERRAGSVTQSPHAMLSSVRRPKTGQREGLFPVSLSESTATWRDNKARSEGLIFAEKGKELEVDVLGGYVRMMKQRDVSVQLFIPSE